MARRFSPVGPRARGFLKLDPMYAQQRFDVLMSFDRRYSVSQKWFIPWVTDTSWVMIYSAIE